MSHDSIAARYEAFVKSAILIAETALRIHEMIRQGNAVQARSGIEELLARFPTECDARGSAARCYEELGDFSEALAQCGIAIALQPSSASIYCIMSRILIRRGEDQVARDVLTVGWKHWSRTIGSRAARQPAEREQFYRLGGMELKPRPRD